MQPPWRILSLKVRETENVTSLLESNKNLAVVGWQIRTARATHVESTTNHDQHGHLDQAVGHKAL